MWVYDQIKEWDSKAEQNVFVVTGNAGLGKSVVMSRLEDHFEIGRAFVLYPGLFLASPLPSLSTLARSSTITL